LLAFTSLQPGSPGSCGARGPWPDNVWMGVSVEDRKRAERVADLVAAHGVPFFFKQWGGPNKKRAGRLLDGRTWDEMPALLKAIEEG
jgi:protein gp37